MSGPWLVFSIALLIVSAVSAGVSTGKVSTGVAVFAFGFALAIMMDELAGGDDARVSRRK